ncbi:MAG: glycolate oxidase subunit GlcF [Pseudomonadota bacterium]
MQTSFTLAQLADPDTAASEQILRTCVHCGFCTATCPTYVLLGDELDSPRGRIYLIKDMLENDRPASAEVAKHVDRCLSCLSCMTTCPSGVNYMHLVDHARKKVRETHRRPPLEQLVRQALAVMLPDPGRFRLALRAAGLARPFKALMPKRYRPMLDLAPARLPAYQPLQGPLTFPAEGARKARVALLAGCAQQVLAPQINQATVRLLTRAGVEVVVAGGTGCCGALVHHMGDEAAARKAARANVAAWRGLMADDGGLDAVVINASGCGTMVKDYGFLLRNEPGNAEVAADISARAKDISELLSELGLPDQTRETGQRVAYHAACSLQHGQKVTAEPKALLRSCGFEVLEVPEGHLCCGSAGTYNILQPEIAGRLLKRKLANIARQAPQAIATGNIGCMTQLASGTETPVVHTVELLDWATGGPKPVGLQ